MFEFRGNVGDEQKWVEIRNNLKEPYMVALMVLVVVLMVVVGVRR